MPIWQKPKSTTRSTRVKGLSNGLWPALVAGPSPRVLRQRRSDMRTTVLPALGGQVKIAECYGPELLIFSGKNGTAPVFSSRPVLTRIHFDRLTETSSAPMLSQS